MYRTGNSDMEKEVELVKTLKEATETRSLWTVGSTSG